jgi:hypothetical protein
MMCTAKLYPLSDFFYFPFPWFLFASGICHSSTIIYHLCREFMGLGLDWAFDGLALELLYTVWEHRQHWSCFIFVSLFVSPLDRNFFPSGGFRA